MLWLKSFKNGIKKYKTSGKKLNLETQNRETWKHTTKNKRRETETRTQKLDIRTGINMETHDRLERKNTQQKAAGDAEDRTDMIAGKN